MSAFSLSPSLSPSASILAFSLSGSLDRSLCRILSLRPVLSRSLSPVPPKVIIIIKLCSPVTAVATYTRMPSNSGKSGKKNTAVLGKSTVVQLFLVNRFPLVPLLSRIQYPGGSGKREKGNYLPPSWAVQEELSPERVDVCVDARGCMDSQVKRGKYGPRGGRTQRREQRRWKPGQSS